MESKAGSERGGEGRQSRRDWLRLAAGGCCGALAMPLLRQGAAPPQGAVAPGRPEAREAYDPSKHDYMMLIDIGKCIGCGACVRACERENGVPPRYFRTWIERYQVSRMGHALVDSPNGGRDGFEPEVSDQETARAFFVPKLCNHCRFTPCVQLCPVGASYRTPDGVVLVDEKRCIGCGYCVQACPYGTRFIHPARHVASKCTLCYHRVTKRLPTACVEACPTGARRLGDLKDPADEVVKVFARQPTHVLRPELLTEPSCYYLGMSKEVR